MSEHENPGVGSAAWRAEVREVAGRLLRGKEPTMLRNGVVLVALFLGPGVGLAQTLSAGLPPHAASILVTVAFAAGAVLLDLRGRGAAVPDRLPHLARAGVSTVWGAAWLCTWVVAAFLLVLRLVVAGVLAVVGVEPLFPFAPVPAASVVLFAGLCSLPAAAAGVLVGAITGRRRSHRWETDTDVESVVVPYLLVALPTVGAALVPEAASERIVAVPILGTPWIPGILPMGDAAIPAWVGLVLSFAAVPLLLAAADRLSAPARAAEEPIGVDGGAA